MRTKQRAPRDATELQARGVPFVPDAPELQAIARERTTAGGGGKAKHVKLDLGRVVDIDARIDFARDPDDPRVVVLYDEGGKRSIPGLRLRIGPRTATWYYSIDKIDHGHRVVRLESLGNYDRGTRDENPIRAPWHWDVEKAREAATVKSAAYIKGEVADGSTTFGEAFADYLDKLQAKADNNGKAARWRENVRRIGAKHLLPRWANFPLAEMSRKREAVGNWYNAIARETPSTGHHCRRIIHALYAWKRRAGSNLPADNPALAPIEKREAYKTKAGRKALPRLPLDQFPAWLVEWRKLPLAMQRAYWLTLILTGARPGELARTVWSDLDEKHGTLTIGNSKNGSDIVVPLSEPIKRALALAREAAFEKTDVIFHGPNAEQWSHREPPLDVPGHGMRRTFKAVASSIGIPNETSGRLLGHHPIGVSAGYDDPLTIVRGRFLREQQARVSAEMLRLFGCDPTMEKIAPAPPPPREVARTAGREQYKSDQPCPQGHVGLRYVATNRCVQCITDRNFRQKANRVNWRKAHANRTVPR
jgi:integrase